MLELIPTRGAMIVLCPLKEACVSHLTIKRVKLKIEFG
jgi:hypothetical protein